jgi:hypothetical protein
MLPGKSGIEGNAVVILGAGASRGECHSGQRATASVLPPLDRDFFAQVQRISPQTVGTRKLLQRARELFGPVPSCTMEEYFTAVESLSRLAPLAEVEREQPDAVHSLKWDVALNAFKDSLLAVLSEAGVASHTDEKAMPPTYNHRLLGCLSRGDGVISFNYDVLADRALAQRFPKRWGYGPTPQDKAQGEVRHWNVHPPEHTQSEPEIILLKMHGSLNWVLRDGAITLTEPPFSWQEMAVIPPAWSKDIQGNDVFGRIWRSALDRLVSASVLVIVGYSLPRTDMWAQALLRHAAISRASAESPLADVVIANPDDHAIHRLISMMGPAIGPGTRLIQLDSMSELCGFLA